MRVFLAGATGVIGVRLVPLLVDAGHVVGGLTRSVDRTARLEDLGAVPYVADALDRLGLLAAVDDFAPDTIINQLTDLPDHVDDLPASVTANARIWREGTTNLLAAARSTGAGAFLAQSVAWSLGGDGEEAIGFLEESVLDAGGTVLRYGQFYGRGTYHEGSPPAPPRIQIDEAAARTVAALDHGPGIVEIVDRGAVSPDPVG